MSTALKKKKISGLICPRGDGGKKKKVFLEIKTMKDETVNRMFKDKFEENQKKRGGKVDI